MVAKNRAVCTCGEDHSKTTLTTKQVRNIKNIESNSDNAKVLSSKFDVDVRVIWDIWNGRTWKHVS